MGTYFKAACDDLKENICPGEVNDLGIKQFSIAHPRHPFGRLVVFAMVTRWQSRMVRIVDDTGRDDPPYFDYVSVTEQVIAEYNETYAGVDGFEPLQFTGRDNDTVYR